MAVADIGIGGAVNAPKLASLVAQRIEEDVAALGWPVGTVLGSESDLLEQFGVSRAVLREAVRIVEHTGAARMRRGPGGGLVVTAPNRQAVVAAMGVWFSYVGVRIGEMLEVREPLLVGAVRLASERRTPEAVAEMAALIDQIAASGSIGPRELMGLESKIALAAANPALALFIDSVGDLGATRLSNGRARLTPAVGHQQLLAHLDGYRSLVAAIDDGDPDEAAAMVHRLIETVRSRLVDAVPRRAGPVADGATDKRAERVATAIRDDIERAKWPVGEVLGSETDLIERYQVSRAILREAVRILEHHGAVRTKRGPYGGVIVTAPDSSAIVRSARTILEFDGVTTEQLFEARSVLEVAAVRLAASRCDEAAQAELRAAIGAEAASGSSALHFMPVHEILAGATGNRLFSLFVEVMGALVPSRVRPVQRTPEGMAALSIDVHHAHERLADAVLAGDADLAERRMLRHLRASVDVLE